MLVVVEVQHPHHLNGDLVVYLTAAFTLEDVVFIRLFIYLGDVFFNVQRFCDVPRQGLAACLDDTRGLILPFSEKVESAGQVSNIEYGEIIVRHVVHLVIILDDVAESRIFWRR